MKLRSIGTAAAAALAFSLSTATVPARAEVSAAAKAEIEHLLTYVASSGCDFYRNGTWYDGKKGQSHLEDKFSWLQGRDMIKQASDFIALAATESSLSHQAYKVRCAGAEPVESAKWLNEELVRFRGALPGAAAPIKKTS